MVRGYPRPINVQSRIQVGGVARPFFAGME
jgi:hypothetical protein